MYYYFTSIHDDPDNTIPASSCNQLPFMKAPNALRPRTTKTFAADQTLTTT